MIENIVVVCFGNICRSPYAQRVLQDRLGYKYTVDSAGIGVTYSNLTNQGAAFRASVVGHLRGVNLEGHRAKQLSPYICTESDLILVMEESQIELVSAIRPESIGKVMRLGKWIDKDIPDPNGLSQEAFEHSYNLIDEAIESWIKKL